ncbi:MAG: hypothetical protein HY934_08195 [Candidatus Firestonebacteria bacterium]|nr:hypothetical protein [Candidatus Firestonebacteria bacterium]
MNNAIATVLFSGGSDSTLCAAQTAEKFGKIELITYKRASYTGLTRIEKSQYYIASLKKVYGDKNIEQIIIDYQDLFSHIFFYDFDRDMKKYGMHLSIFVCMACKLAMHTKTIIYNIKNNIKHTADGSFHGQDHSPEQMSDILIQLKNFYSKYGVEFSYPVYFFPNKDDIQKELFKRGIALTEHFKHKKLSTTDSYIFHKNQPACYLGIIAGGYSKFIFGPLWGKKKREEMALEYYNEKQKIAEIYLEKELSRF